MFDLQDITKEMENEVQGLDFNSLNALPSKHDLWLESKRGVFSASEFHRLMGYEDKPDFPKGAETYAMEKAIETLTIKEEGYTNDIMQRGNELEIDAMHEFMRITGLEVTKFGADQEFLTIGKHVGCTPDGIIKGLAGVEGKAPNSKTHFNYLTTIKNQNDLKKVCKDYYWQCQGGMYVANLPLWYFFSYDPRFKNPAHQMHIIKVHRNDEDIEKLKPRLKTAISVKLDYIKKLNG
ncbi:lambda exonuclease family protein [Aquimarina intermedia]|uniref:YqaJ-like recombinase protein n=1 Tax=Aquimarina intermedia TaxID=350814 RepID=A0A5S5BX20_9FLAO|nr:lambda exonuclease family protein [Aquimarina intermedia]TYP71519.1 YqaJ-like recombinase protein [Aquimarina intermedia]